MRVRRGGVATPPLLVKTPHHGVDILRVRDGKVAEKIAYVKG